MLQTESSFGERGALNLEWKVLPSKSRFEEIPVVPVARAIEPTPEFGRHRVAAKIVFKIKSPINLCLDQISLLWWGENP